MQGIDYSIVVPVYNSAGVLAQLTARIIAAMQGYTFEIIFVNDGSTDGSWAELKSIKSNNPAAAITAINLSKNYGQHNATLCGCKHSKGNFIVTIDDDLENPPEEIHKLIATQAQTGADVVYGLYNDNSALKGASKKMLFGIAKKAINNNIGNASSFRLIKKSIIESLTAHMQYFVRIDELIGWYTGHIAMVQVEHHPRTMGKSGYSFFRLVKLSFKIFFNYYSVPLKFIVSLGFYITIFAIGLGIFFIIKKLFFNVPIAGWTSLMVTMQFSTGIIVFSLGIIGRYIMQILHIQNSKPSYNIAEIV